jgi:large subunit ribosomal protein L24
MNLRKGNLVKILTGKDKNKSGEIIELIGSLNKAKVKGINIVKKHLKATKEKKGGIISKENFIHLSNLRLVEDKDKKNKNKIDTKKK